MLKRVVIENYRSCLRTSIDLHPKLSVLIGPNGSGKTNILQAIMLLNKMASEPERLTRRNAAAVSSRIKASFRERAAEIHMNATLDSFTDESNIEKPGDRRDVLLVKAPVPRCCGACPERPEEESSGPDRRLPIHANIGRERDPPGGATKRQFLARSALLRAGHSTPSLRSVAQGRLYGSAE